MVLRAMPASSKGQTMINSVQAREKFEAWAVDHLGQGYSLEWDEGYVDKVTRWAFKAWLAAIDAVGAARPRQTGAPCDFRCPGCEGCMGNLPALPAGCQNLYTATQMREYAHAAKTAQPTTPAPGETGWLIEVHNGTDMACWLTADNTYANDSNLAFRFARECDAKAFLKVFLSAKFGDDIASIFKRRFSSERYSVTEHIWHGDSAINTATAPGAEK